MALTPQEQQELDSLQKQYDQIVGSLPEDVKKQLGNTETAQPQQSLGDAAKGLLKTATTSGTPPQGAAIKSLLTAPKPVQEGLIRAGATGMGEALAGPAGAATGAAASNTAIDAINSPTARNAMQQVTQGMATGQPAQGALAVAKGIASNPDAVLSSLKNSALQAGAAAATSGALNLVRGVTPTGPMTAGMASPSTALPGNLGRAGKVLGEAKTVATAGEDIGNLPELLQSGPGIRRLGKAARDAVGTLTSAELKALPTSQLLAMRSAVGKLQKVGGEFADEYSKTFKALSDVLREKAPEVMKGKALVHLAKLAKGTKAENQLPYFIGALSPAAGVVKTAMMAPVRNVAGAVLRTGLEAAVPAAPVATNLTSQALSAALNKLGSIRRKYGPK